MTKDISIFDIPHVMEKVGSYLDHRDRLSCALVSKSFHNEFNRLLWRELVFQRHPISLETEPNFKQLEALQTNAQLIRKVSFDTQCGPGILPLLSESCTSLRDLAIFVHRIRIDDPEEMSFVPVLDLINRNTQLRTCTFIRHAELSSNALGKLTMALSQSPCLTELVLMFHISPLPRGWLQHVLQSLPKSLKTLVLQWRRLKVDDMASLPAQEWPESYPNLEVAKLMLHLTKEEEHMLFQFLNRCPTLKDCHVPTLSTIQSIDHFIDLLATERLPSTLTRIDCRNWGELNEHQWKNLMWAMNGRIRSFVTGLEFNIPPTRHYIYDMTNCLSQTLESLHIYNSHLIASSDIQLILTTCPKLKKFECFCYWLLMIHRPQRGESKALPGLQAMVSDEDGVSTGVMADWVCLELEELKLTFSDGRSTSAAGPMLLQQEQCAAKGIERVYQQIGRLTKLRELTIGWCSITTFMKDANLDMSLQSGMGHMDGLKSLRMIDVGYIPTVNIRMKEVQWMLDNWPMLRKIDGVVHRYPMVEGEIQEPDYISLLRSKRPSVVIV
ncbi:MAG: hypothetical protein J3Q66DRAFT_396401 [Benniella sp.]|nr:MAG: hypothetical protein J3Q66DRAFT_396401 [Benniella sp.]